MDSFLIREVRRTNGANGRFAGKRWVLKSMLIGFVASVTGSFFSSVFVIPAFVQLFSNDEFLRHDVGLSMNFAYWLFLFPVSGLAGPPCGILGNYLGRKSLTRHWLRKDRLVSPEEAGASLLSGTVGVVLTLVYSVYWITSG